MAQMRALLVALVAFLLLSETMCAPRPFANAAQHKTPEKPGNPAAKDTAKNAFTVMEKFTKKKAASGATGARRLLLQSGFPAGAAAADLLEVENAVSKSIFRQLRRSAN